jgi:hypothetical protein
VSQQPIIGSNPGQWQEHPQYGIGNQGSQGWGQQSATGPNYGGNWNERPGQGSQGWAQQQNMVPNYGGNWNERPGTGASQQNYGGNWNERPAPEAGAQASQGWAERPAAG